MKLRIVNLILGPPGRLRSSVWLTLLGLATYVVFSVLQHAEVLLGFIDQQESAWLTGYYLLGSLVFYLLVRSGLSERMSSDPSMMFLQILFGVLAIVWSYAITGPARGAVLAILVLTLTFGMFGLPVRQARRLALGSGLLLAATMAWKSQTDPLRYPPLVEAIHMAFAAIVLLGVSAMSVRMGALRERLRTQKLALESSLERINLLATLDELTGLPNRRHLLALLKTEQARQQRTLKPLSLVLLDLDHFKNVNDSYGHQAGDDVLRGFAAATGSTLRGTDVLSRWGGEEFLLMLPDTGEDEAVRCVERMRQGLAQRTFDTVAPDLKVTFSAGLSVCTASDSQEAAIERADQAMYRAKAQGRNRTERAIAA